MKKRQLIYNVGSVTGVTKIKWWTVERIYIKTNPEIITETSLQNHKVLHNTK